MKDPRFATNTDRVKHREECVGGLAEIFEGETTAHWVSLIAKSGVPCGPINKVSEVVTDPQVLARNMIMDVEHPNVPGLKFPNSPFKLSESPPIAYRHPPLLGQHNAEVLAECGYSADQIADLRQRGIIGGAD